MKILLIVLVFLFIQIFFISSYETKSFTESTNIGNLFGLDEENVIASAGIEYSEIKDLETKEEGVRLTFMEEGASLNVGENLFANIVPQKDAGHPTYLELDENGKIIGADFTTNEKGGNYTFGNNTIEVPPNSRVFFNKDTGIKIEISDGLDLTEFPNLLKYISDGYLTTIKGQNIKFSDDLSLINGELRVEQEGYFLRQGIADYNKVRVTTSEEEGGLLISDSAEWLKEYTKNYIAFGEGELRVKGIEGGKVNLEILPGNSLFKTTEKSNLKFEVSNEDSFVAFSDEGQTFIGHDPSKEGYTTIENGEYRFKIEKGKIISEQLSSEEKISNENLGSVPFTLFSSTPKAEGFDLNLEADYRNRFIIRSPEGKERIFSQIAMSTKKELDNVRNYIMDNPTGVYDVRETGYPQYELYEYKLESSRLLVSPYYTLFDKTISKEEETMILCDHGNDGIADKVIFFLNGAISEPERLLARMECTSSNTESLENRIEVNDRLQRVKGQTSYNTRFVLDLNDGKFYDFSENKITSVDVDHWSESISETYSNILSLFENRVIK